MAGGLRDTAAGIGLKPRHAQAIVERRPALGFVEIHAENYMCAGAPHRHLERVAADYPLSIHGVGLSLGSAEPPDPAHLTRLVALERRYRPALLSEHVSWSRIGNGFHADLLPLPYSHEALDHLVRNVEIAQAALSRPLLMENPSTYLEFIAADYDEPEFLGELVRRSGCGLIMDVNNVFVRAANHGFDAEAYLRRIPWDAVGEIHLAGHAVERVGDHEIRIDDHGSAVIDPVWRLYRLALELGGPRPTLIERDNNIPDLATLVAEAAMAARLMEMADAQAC